MKLSEKTLELNICAQVLRHVDPKQKLLWFGLTQRQEARAGFDACTKLNGRLLIFQFKASNRIVRKNERVFHAPHKQLVTLRNRARYHARSIFYAFPLVGNTFELKHDSDLISQTWLVDVASLHNIGTPTKPDGSLRKNDCHNVYVTPGQAIFHSLPVKVEAISLQSLIEANFSKIDGVYGQFRENLDLFCEFGQSLSPNTYGLVVY